MKYLLQPFAKFPRICIPLAGESLARSFGAHLALVLGLALFFLSMPAAADPVSLRKVYTGELDYLARGASFRNQPNGVNACSFVANSSTADTVTTGPRSITISSSELPGTATVLEAYLYVAGSANINGAGTAVDFSNSTNLRLNGNLVSTTAGFGDVNYNDLENLAGITGVDFFAARRDVSSIVTGPGTYTLENLVVFTGAARAANETCLGGWSLVIIYKDTSISDLRVINLFDGFQDFQNNGPGGYVLEPRNFVIDPTNLGGKMTHISFEGDDSLPSGAAPAPENFAVRVPTATGVYANKTNAVNSATNQFNNTISSPDLSPSITTAYGVDVDTYDLASDLVGKGNEYTMETRYISGQDLVILVGEVVLINNKPLADIEVFLSTTGTFQENTSDESAYLIDVINNGDGIPGTSSGEATGTIYVYSDLPTGVSIDSIPSGAGWDCSATNLGANQVRCEYDLSTLPGDGDLDQGDSLPTITVSVDIATPASPVTNRAYASLCAGSSDTCTTFAGKHTDADQFDPVNFFGDLQDLFDVLVKSATNNNVDQEITTITAGPNGSDLTTSQKLVQNQSSGDINDTDVGDTLRYTIDLIESGGNTAIDVGFLDDIPADTTFVPGSLFVGGVLQPDPGGATILLSGLTVPASSTLQIRFDVSINGLTALGTVIDNTATISNPGGVPVDTDVDAPSVTVTGSPSGGNKQLYLNNLGGGSPVLTRVLPSVASSLVVAQSASVNINLVSNTTRAMQIEAGTITVNLWLSASTWRRYSLDLQVNTGGGFASVATNGAGTWRNVGTTPSLQTFTFVLPASVSLPAGSSIRLRISNTTTFFSGSFTVSQVAPPTTPYADLVLPMTDTLDVTSLLFYDRSALDNTGNPGCELTFSCGNLLSPAQVATGDTIWVRAVIADGFGSSDVNTGCTGGAPVNCPTFTLLDPNSVDKTPVVPTLTFLNAPDASSRRYEVEINPAGFGLEGTWTVSVTGNEGTEGVIATSALNTFLRAGQPVLTVAKSVSGTPDPGLTLTYTNIANNAPPSATGPAINVFLTNDIAPFLEFELIGSGGVWVSTSTLSAGYTINTESFDTGGAGNFLYDPNVGCLGPPAADGAICYDGNIDAWRVLLNEDIPVSGQVTQTYKVRLQP
ncbi:MAG: DUF11 domain-containing protein [Pseudomonadota bacterium]